MSDFGQAERNGPGVVVLFGSGETSHSGRKAFDRVMRQLPQPPRVTLLETPAGFELNSDRVIGKIEEFLRVNLQNYQPQVQVAAARKRGTAFSPDDPLLADLVLQADLVFVGPGSPTYAVRQLQSSAVWHALLASHRLGAAVVLASAGVIAASTFALPVYEIYKVGEDLHWKPGLDLFGQYGLPLVFVPHWNNNDGGDELDTSRCFMGQERFAQLARQLPDGLTVIGIDEKTALMMDLQVGQCEVIGIGGVTLIHTGHDHQPAVQSPTAAGSGLSELASQRHSHVHHYASGDRFPLEECCQFQIPSGGQGLPAHIWQRALALRAQPADPLEAPAEVQALASARQAARESKDWAGADALRKQIAALGWQVQDTPQGPQLSPLEKP